MEKNCDCNKDHISSSSTIGIMAQMPEQDRDEPCCGRPAEPPSSPLEKPGYVLCHFVENFISTEAGAVPRIKTKLQQEDYYGSFKALSGINRYNYKITPGLYCVGTPDRNAPVFVSANYKYSFDSLRKNLDRLNAWVLVLDTRGINVWCAAGKATFSTDEIVRQINSTGLDKLIDKKELILPQLSATGVSAEKLKKASGFKVFWGPMRAADIKRFLEAGNKASPEMREATFTLKERLSLIPIEISLALKPLLWTFLVSFILSGIGPGIFSLGQALSRSMMIIIACIAGIISGAVAVPLLLQWLPGRAFSIKGVFTGLFASVWTVICLWGRISAAETIALFLFVNIISSFLAMNFTGTTPFTSPSGVEKEMRKAIPIQAGALLLAVILWILAPFAG